MFNVKTPEGSKKVSLYTTHSKGSVAGTATGVGQDVIGAGAGAVTGAFVGGPVSLAGGFLSLILGHYTGIQVLKPFGVGMVLSAGYDHNHEGQNTTAPNPEGFNAKEEMDNGGQRVSNWITHFKSKFSLQQFIPEKTDNGDGTQKLEGFAEEMAQLDQIEADLVSKAVSFRQRLASNSPAPKPVSQQRKPRYESY